jgi:hypothetical protein
MEENEKREIPVEELQRARESVMQRIESIETQGCLPIEGWKLTQYVALFDGEEPDAASRAVWSLVDDKTLVYDQVNDTVDIRERLENLLGKEE